MFLDYNDVTKIKDSTKLFGSGLLNTAQIGNKSGSQLIINKAGCSHIYYFVHGGTIQAWVNLGEGHDGSSLLVIDFDGCSTGSALNKDQAVIDSILATFFIK